jgi:hypothetical protein
MTESSCEDRSDDAAPAKDSWARFMSHHEMNVAYLSGLAVPLAQSVSWLVRYQGSWWVVYEGGWLRITDDLVEADIDSCHSRLTEAAGAANREVGLDVGDGPPRHDEFDQ